MREASRAACDGRFGTYDFIVGASADSMAIPAHIARRIALRVRGRVLDIGCGDGRKLAALLDDCDTGRIAEVWVAEPSDRLRDELARRLPEARVLPAYLNGLSAQEMGQFDCILLLEVLEHLPDHADALRRIGQLLAPAGTCVISTPNRPVHRLYLRMVGRPNDPTHVSELNVRQFTRLCKAWFANTEFLGCLPLASLLRHTRLYEWLSAHVRSLRPSAQLYCIADHYTDPEAASGSGRPWGT